MKSNSDSVNVTLLFIDVLLILNTAKVILLFVLHKVFNTFIRTTFGF